MRLQGGTSAAHDGDRLFALSLKSRRTPTQTQSRCSSVAEGSQIERLIRVRRLDYFCNSRSRYLVLSRERSQALSKRVLRNNRFPLQLIFFVASSATGFSASGSGGNESRRIQVDDGVEHPDNGVVLLCGKVSFVDFKDHDFYLPGHERIDHRNRFKGCAPEVPKSLDNQGIAITECFQQLLKTMGTRGGWLFIGFVHDPVIYLTACEAAG
jgi:hypothetical protein